MVESARGESMSKEKKKRKKGTERKGTRKKACRTRTKVNAYILAGILYCACICANITSKQVRDSWGRLVLGGRGNENSSVYNRGNAWKGGGRDEK